MAYNRIIRTLQNNSATTTSHKTSIGYLSTNSSYYIGTSWSRDINSTMKRSCTVRLVQPYNQILNLFGYNRGKGHKNSLDVIIKLCISEVLVAKLLEINGMNKTQIITVKRTKNTK